MICEPGFRKLRKIEPKIWDEDCQHVFDTIKDYLSNPPVLKPAIPGAPLRLYLTTTDLAVGAMLAQEIEGKENVVYYLSKKLLEYETRYTELERLTLNGRLSRWLVMLAEFDLKYIPQRFSKGSTVSYFLADCPIEVEEEDYDLPDEQILMKSDDSWSLHFDGASNQIGCGVGVILVAPDGTHIHISAKLQFNVTNNATEYEACIMVRSESLAPYESYLEKLSEQVEELRYTYLPREENQFADALEKLASMVNIPNGMAEKPLTNETRLEAAYVHAIDDVEHDRDEPWFTNIQRYLQISEYPPHFSSKSQRALRLQLANFVLEGDIPYKRSSNGPNLQSVEKYDAHRVMDTIHAGVCGTHMNGKMLSRKVIRNPNPIIPEPTIEVSSDTEIEAETNTDEVNSELQQNNKDMEYESDLEEEFDDFEGHEHSSIVVKEVG
ncbi:uncharacterized protein [Spinacia oleracea]|uniref:Reverse transcriptase/retrotransposon-derived protein RNase H-like domain-containing protein n=1 Tax=Spinacia oleracea TaxID=3562 RepID=A0ABM3RQE6_SPIOL|nr:uncharacterized protein LOC130471631 [Spinacia oleracea]